MATNRRLWGTSSRSQIGDLQKDIGDKQSDLADEQEDIQDIRAGQIRLKSVASIKVENAPTTVRHNDGDKAITIKGTPVPDSDLTKVGNDFNAAVASVQIPDGVSLDTGGALEEQQKANRQLVLAMLAAIVLVFIIMVATFKSLWQPLILLPAIPVRGHRRHPGSAGHQRGSRRTGHDRSADADRHRGHQRHRAD